MKILLVLDPLKKLNTRWDNSLRLALEFNHRGHECYAADAPDFFLRKNELWVKTQTLKPRSLKRLMLGIPRKMEAKSFDLIVIRKEPPVDNSYIRLTKLLDEVTPDVPIVNSPNGIRETNEKLSILHFPKWIPKTLVSSSPETLLKFQSRLKKPIVIKPLDQKGGRGIFIIRDSSRRSRSRILRAFQNGSKTLMAQEFLKTTSGEKRIVLLHGEIFCYYEKRPKGKEFRANLSLGATFHKVPLTLKERRLCKTLKPFLLKRGLEFVGIDVLNGKLIEINVTSPAGVTESTFLEPKLRLVEAWADFLEDFSRR